MEPTTPTLELQAGLSARELHRRLRAAHRATDLGHRALAFYLNDMAQRGLHLLLSCSSAAHYAESRLGLGARLSRELPHLGARLLELPELDKAFAEGQLSWSKVRLLCRVVVAETQDAWIERGTELTCRKLERQVRQCAQGDKPPSDRRLGLPELRFSVHASLSALEQQLWDQAKEMLAAERGRPVTDAELIRHAAELMLGQGQPDKASRGSRFQVVVHQCPDCGESTVDSELGRVALDPVEASVAACDAEHRSLERIGAIDEPTPERLRRAVLARDGGQCLYCGSRVGLQVHHLTFRSLGGPTSQENLCTTCSTCHMLVHSGKLKIEGTATHGLQFFDGDSHALQPGEPADPLVRILMTGDVGTRVPDRGPEPPDLGELPDVVDAGWFWAHEHLFKWKLAPPGRRAQ